MKVLSFQVILTSFQPRRSQTVAGSPGWMELPFLGDPVQHLDRVAAEGLSWDSLELGKRAVKGSSCSRDQAAPGLAGNGQSEPRTVSISSVALPEKGKPAQLLLLSLHSSPFSLFFFYSLPFSLCF